MMISEKILFTCAMSCTDDFYHMPNNDKVVFIMSYNNVIVKKLPEPAIQFYTHEDVLYITSQHFNIAR